MDLKIKELGLEFLSNTDVENINGGESGWYWVIRHISDAIYHPNVKASRASTAVYTDGSIMFY